MAVVTTKSTAVTNRDATPEVLNNARINGTNLRCKKAVVTAVAGDSTTSKYVFFDLPSNAAIQEVDISNVAQGGTSTMDVGFQNTTKNGGGAITGASGTPSQFFKAGSAISGAQARVDITQGNVITPTNSEQPLWQQLGFSADTFQDYDVVGTVQTAAITNGGAIEIEVWYTI